MILHAADELLVTAGCLAFDMDALSGAVGIPKGTLYRHTESRDSLIEAVLDRRLNALVPADPKHPNDASDALTVLLRKLFGVTGRRQRVETLFPCCLRTSPCPHAWTSRWQIVSAAYGLAATERTAILGEAIQAFAALPHTRTPQQGRFTEHFEFLRALLGGSPRDG